MFLKKLRLQNFKCLSDIELSFEQDGGAIRKLTLILGENGTGKSNLLKAIVLVTAGSNALGELLGNVDSWIKNGASACTVEAVLQTKNKEERRISITINRGDTLSKIISNNQEALFLIDEALEYTERTYFVVAYGASRRLSTEALGRGFKSDKSNRFSSVQNLFNSSAPLNPLTSWVMTLDYRSGKSGLKIVEDALNDFLPGTTFQGIDKEKEQILFQTADGIVPLEQLSDGYQNMAAWIGDLLFRVSETFRDFKRPMEARGLLLIDEIDLHLHPKWQRRLIDFIDKKLPNFQVIATTHSPLTAQQADEGELYALKRNELNRVELVPFVGSPKNLLVNQLLMTPVFGLETDESFEIQQAKKTYEQLKSRGMTLDEDEKNKLDGAMHILNGKLPKRDMPAASKRELDLLEKIEQHLNLSKEQ